MPAAFRSKYGNTRVIINAAEIEIDQPKKSRHTIWNMVTIQEQKYPEVSAGSDPQWNSVLCFEMLWQTYFEPGNNKALWVVGVDHNIRVTTMSVDKRFCQNFQTKAQNKNYKIYRFSIQQLVTTPDIYNTGTTDTWHLTPDNVGLPLVLTICHAPHQALEQYNTLSVLKHAKNLHE